ncbi:MAG: transglycosylase SLT domain-containing protein [Acidobacteriota bacterium]|nr:transglycosylase SLT domain-containing protein [Acidobacteriota bacterium]
MNPGTFANRRQHGWLPAWAILLGLVLSATAAVAQDSCCKASEGKHRSKKAAGNTKAQAEAGHHKPLSRQALKLHSAFLESSELRPMAQQLAATRSAAAYAGVQAYAQAHTGEAAATAYLALGHAYAQDHRYPEALTSYRRASALGEALDDYAEYLAAQADVAGGHPGDAYTLLDHFATRHPESIFAATAPVLLATAHIQQNDAAGALRVLLAAASTSEASHTDYRYTLARAYQLTGDTGHAVALYRGLYIGDPLAPEAAQALSQLQAMGAYLSAAERKQHADQLFNAHHYAEAGAEYHSILQRDATLNPADKDALAIYAAVCDLKQKHLTRREIERLPNTSDDSAALKLYMLAEVSRSEDDTVQHDAILTQMVQRFPTSRWLEEALYSGGNMYLLRHDPRQATLHYSLLVKMFPSSSYAPSAHWRAAWMNYRLRNYAEAARLMEEQVQRYPAGIEVPAALYWRGRILEDQEHNFAQAANFYRAIVSAYTSFYYANLARQRLSVLGVQPSVAPSAVLGMVRHVANPGLNGQLPEGEPHLIKARLLANAALNEFISPEIQSSPNSSAWGALAEAQIYSSYGETSRALQALKHSGIPFFSLPVDQVPASYWTLLFPRPYWSDLTADAQRNGLDPFLVAALIRQESEFNPGAVSHANAVGLMQLLPSLGKVLARRQGMKGFGIVKLLNPATNLQLGTANLKSVLDRFGGQPEYALAAYNAGDVPVRQWMSSGDYKDLPEFVESIPYSETRDYVQAILRNREMYRLLYSGR